MNRNIKFYKQGPVIRFSDIDKSDLVEELAPAVYQIVMVDKSPALVKKFDKYTVPEKILGERTDNNIRRIGRLHARTDKPMGVMITGDKGTGKSILAKLTCNEYIEKHKKIVIEVVDALPVSVLNYVIEAIDDEVCVFFDEFAKRQGGRDSDGDILSDDTYLNYFENADYGRILNIVTENKTSDMSTYLLGRSSRMKLHFKYDEICKTEVEACLTHFEIPEERRGLIRSLVKSCKLNIDLLSDICNDLKDDPELLNDLTGYMSVCNIENYSEPGITFKRLAVISSKSSDWVTSDISVKLNDDFSATCTFGDIVHEIPSEELKLEGNVFYIEHFRMLFDFGAGEKEILIPKNKIIDEIDD